MGARTTKTASRGARALIAALLAALILALPAAAEEECCGGAVVIDLDTAFDNSQREGRDPIEGQYETYLRWHPDKGSPRRYRVAITRNVFDVFEDWDYVAASTCGQDGCKRGEIKMILKRTAAPRIFDAKIITKDGFAEGRALLGPDPEDGRPDSGLDTSAVTYEGRTLADWFFRVEGY